jgi:hypothetical protein
MMKFLSLLTPAGSLTLALAWMCFNPSLPPASAADTNTNPAVTAWQFAAVDDSLHLPGVPLALNDSGTPAPSADQNTPSSSQSPTEIDTLPPPVFSDQKTEDFARHSWSFQTYGSVSFGSRTGRLYLAHMGLGYFLLDGFSINLEAVGGGVREPGAFAGEDDWATLAGFDLLARWHFLRGEGWSIYAEAGAGMIYASREFPPGGTHFNFSPQVGLGATVRVMGDARLMLGCRYHHISNASIQGSDRNPGFDGIMPYAGLMFRF